LKFASCEAVLSSIALLAIGAIAGGCVQRGQSGVIPGEVRIGYLGTIYTLNPIIAFGQRLIDLTQLYTQPLVGISPQNKAIPVLCTRVPTTENGGVSRDGLTITYHLRHVRFADGVPFTSKDVAFTYRAILDPRNPVTEAEPYLRIASLETPDPHTVVIHLRRRWEGAVYELFAASDYIYGILPAHAFASTDVTRSSWNEHPFGTGPFEVVRWNRGDSIVLDRNPYAWQPPKLDRVVIKMIPDENSAFVALQAHAIDFTDITYAQVSAARAVRGVRVVAVPRNEADDIEFQTQSPAVADLEIRRAIAYAIDRATIARSVYLGYSPLATTEIPPLFPEHDAAIRAYPYDPARARAILGRRRLAMRISFNLSENTYAAVATVVQANLRAVGVDATLHGATPSLLYAPPAQHGVLYDGLFELEIGGWYGGLDPEASEPWTCANRAPSGPNVARWCDRLYDDAFADQQTRVGAARTADFTIMQNRVHDRLPVMFLVYRTEFEAIDSALRGFAPNMLYNFSQTQDWSTS
jgi:peptide/nickel transport system substrate-binding protein